MKWIVNRYLISFFQMKTANRVKKLIDKLAVKKVNVLLSLIMPSISIQVHDI